MPATQVFFILISDKHISPHKTRSDKYPSLALVRPYKAAVALDSDLFRQVLTPPDLGFIPDLGSPWKGMVRYENSLSTERCAAGANSTN